MIDSKQSLRQYLAEDMAGHDLASWRLRYRLTRRPAYFQRLLRKSEYWGNVRTDPVGRLVFAWYALRTKLLAERLGYTIPRNVFGPGLSIAHIGTITVNGCAVVGARCRIHQGVTIGSGRGYPAIGDDVFLGPNSMVLGAKVGDRVEVRPGAVVITDVPDDVHVAGVPARILARRPDDTADRVARP